MQLATVIGDVVSTVKDPNLTGMTLLVLQPITPAREPAGRTLVALDAVGAGVGEDVFFVRGREASFPFHPVEAPTDACIVGIVDHWSMEPPRQPARRAGQAMQLGRAVGTVVSTQKHPKLEGAKLLLVQPLTLDDRERGTVLLTVDAVGAGVGEKVLYLVEGRAAGEALGRKGAAVDAAIVGIVDRVDVEEEGAVPAAAGG